MKTIDLEGRVPGGEGIDIVRVQVSLEPKAPLVIVQYKENGEEPQYGLRLDLDKSSFLDHLEDPRKDFVLRAAIPKIADIVEQTINPYGAVGALLKSQYTTVVPDSARPGIWIVPAVHGLVMRAYVPMGIDAGSIAPTAIAQHINRFVHHDLFVIMPPVSCTWYFVLCGLGWTDDLIASIQLQTAPHFTNDVIKVVSFADLTWFDQRFRVSVIADVQSPGVFVVTFDPREQIQRASSSPRVRVDTNQIPPTTTYTAGGDAVLGISQTQYEEEAMRRVQGTRELVAA